IDTGLVNLQKVWMNFCQLRLLEQGAFEKLANLVELDLSDNYLNAVPTAALSDISGLRNLYLARNNLGPLRASIFTSVPSLVRLDVSYNNISSINVHAFRTLSRLEVLKLSGNHLTTLSVNVLKPLVALHGLHVDNNPWHCDCHLRLLRQWLFQRNVAASIPPHCESPQRLKGRGWQTLGEDEFVCVPLVTAVAQRVLASHGDNVSLACRVETDPNAAVTWLVDDRPVINTSAQTDHRYRVLELVAPKRDARVSNLTIAGAAVQDQGIYRCVAENKAGRVETNLTLKVSHRIKETALIALDKVFVTGALFGSIVFIFIVCTISCAILYRRNKRTRMPIKVVSNTNQASPQVSVRDQNSQLSRMKTEVDYHVVPTSESFNKFKVVNEKNIITSKDGSGDQIIFEKLNPTNSSSTSQEKSSKQNNLGLKGISKTVSYVEMPKSDGGETDPLLKEIYKETSFVRSTGFTSSQTSLIGYNSPFPDLLDLPRGSQMGSVDRLPFCTMPRR
ncbi:Immunoglobulin I-set, partial [Trinorchestia longiramus]